MGHMYRHTIAALIAVVLCALVATVADEMISKSQREDDCRVACVALDGHMAAVGAYGCVCRDENGPFVLGESIEE
jgi:hypothetical protein